jgi:hypothetical protein
MFPAICVPGKRGAFSRADVKASSARALQFSAQGHATTCVMINRVRGRGGDQRDMPHIPFPAKQWPWSSFPPDVGESPGHGAQPGPDVVQMAAWAWLRDDVTRVYTDTARRSAERFWPRIHALHVPPASDRAPPEAKHVRWSPSPTRPRWGTYPMRPSPRRAVRARSRASARLPAPRRSDDRTALIVPAPTPPAGGRVQCAQEPEDCSASALRALAEVVFSVGS